MSERISETITFHFDNEEQQKRFHERLEGSGLTPHSTAVSAIAQERDIGKMVERLNDFQKTLPTGAPLELLVSEAASILIALDAERGRLRTALREIEQLTRACMNDGAHGLGLINRIARSALPASDEGTNNE
jgi:hypothetical protein